MPIAKVVGLGPGHIVLDGDPVGTQPPQQPLPTFGSYLLWPNGRPSQQLLSSCLFCCLVVSTRASIMIIIHVWLFQEHDLFKKIYNVFWISINVVALIISCYRSCLQQTDCEFAAVLNYLGGSFSLCTLHAYINYGPACVCLSVCLSVCMNMHMFCHKLVLYQNGWRHY